MTCAHCFLPLPHDWDDPQILYCVPPVAQLRLQNRVLTLEYRRALYQSFPHYTVAEIVDTFAGRNPQFPGQTSWHRVPRLRPTVVDDSSGEESETMNEECLYEGNEHR